MFLRVLLSFPLCVAKWAHLWWSHITWRSQNRWACGGEVSINSCKSWCMAHIPGTAVFWVERWTISKMKNFSYITIWNLHCIYMFVGFVWNETMYCTWFICCLITYKVKEKSKKCWFKLQFSKNKIKLNVSDTFHTPSNQQSNHILLHL